MNVSTTSNGRFRIENNGLDAARGVQTTVDDPSVNSEASDTLKVKVIPYTCVRRGITVREDTYPEPSASEVGWPVPVLAAFTSSVLPPDVHSLLGEQ